MHMYIHMYIRTFICTYICNKCYKTVMCKHNLLLNHLSCSCAMVAMVTMVGMGYYTPACTCTYICMYVRMYMCSRH